MALIAVDAGEMPSPLPLRHGVRDSVLQRGKIRQHFGGRAGAALPARGGVGSMGGDLGLTKVDPEARSGIQQGTGPAL